MTDPLKIPPNTIRAHVVDGININPDEHIRPCPPKRQWMDRRPHRKHSYRVRRKRLFHSRLSFWERYRNVVYSLSL